MVRATSLNSAVGFNQHVAAILQDFQKQYAWLDKEKSSIGVFLVDALAGISEVGQTHLMFAMREAFLQKARRESSILAGVKFLGIEISRKSGSAVVAQLRNNSDNAVTINAFSQFSVGQKPFYNPNGAILQPRSILNLFLKQGEVKIKTVDLSSLDLVFPVINLDVPEHIVSNEDIQINTISNNIRTQWYKHSDSLYELNSSDRKYMETTTEKGDVSFLFGNGEFGTKLPDKGILEIRYIITQGSNGNIGSPGAVVNYNVNNSINGVTVEGAVGGSDQKNADFYKFYGSRLFESRGNLIKPSDWEALAEYPDIADIVPQGQKDLAPDDPSYMNVVRLCVLPINSSNWGGANPNPTSGQWTRFLKYVKERSGRHLTIIPHNPEKILVDISIEVYVYEDQNTEMLKTEILEDINKFFARRTGILGRALIPSSDLDRVARRTLDNKIREGVDYIKILSPTVDIIPASKIEYVSPRSIQVLVKYTDRKRETF
jgi:hypothetical protein